jgi:hypothetical protein
MGSSCIVTRDSSVPELDTVVVTLPEPIRPGAISAPRTLAERFVARHSFANLVKLTCAGDVVPDLAKAWKPEDGGRSWVFTLADASISAEAVKSLWESRRNGGIWPWPAILDVEVVDSFALRVRLDTAYPSLPLEFVDPALAVVGLVGRDNVAISTGEYQARGTVFPRAGPVAATTYLDPVSFNARGPTIKLQLLRAGVDPRDALDFPRAGTLGPSDLLITRDTATIGLARSRPEFRVVPLAWDVTYAMMGRPQEIVIPRSFRGALTAAGVPGDSRNPESWPPTSSICRIGQSPTAPQLPPRIAYSNDDPIARALAERLVAMAVTPSHSWIADWIPGANQGNRPRTLPMSPSALDSAITLGRPYAFVVATSRSQPLSCESQIAGSVLPLIDSRPYAIIRRGVPALEIDGEGLVRLHPRMPTRP